MLVRYYAPCGHTSGYAHAANELAFALLGAGAELEIRPIGPGPKFEGSLVPLASHVKTDEQLTVHPDVVIIHTACRDAGVMLDGLIERGAFSSGTKVVAYTTWEASTPVTAQVMGWLSGFDQIWVPSQDNLLSFFARDNGDEHRVHRVPHSFDEGAVELRRGDMAPRPGKFRFYYVGAWNGRKNPAGILRAWAMAFQPTDDVELRIHAMGAQQGAFVIAAHATGLQQHEMAKITFTNAELTEDEILALHRDSDCFVTTSRGEAWNLPAFDALLAGRMIISTQGLGSDDFLRETSAVLVPGTVQPAQDDVEIVPEENGPPGMARLRFTGAQGVTSKSGWIEPDLTRVAEMMRRVYETKRRDLELHYNLHERFGRRAVGLRAMNLLRKAIES